MKDLELILSIAGGALTLLITAITFIGKFIVAVKNATKEQRLRLLAEFAQEAVSFVEQVKGKSNGDLTGEAKKEMALTKINQMCINAGIAFDEAAADKLIEQAVAFTKAVNGRDKDKIKSEVKQNGTTTINL